MSVFRPSWFAYPHMGIAVIMFSESDCVKHETMMGKGEFIKEATEDEIIYQEQGILQSVVDYHSIITKHHSENSGHTSGFAS